MNHHDSGLCSTMCSGFVFACVKLSRYFAVYDSDNRQKLLDAYDDDVSFCVNLDRFLSDTFCYSQLSWPGQRENQFMKVDLGWLISFS
mgnify:CR=1 FL=1